MRACLRSLYWNSELSYPISVLVDKKPTPQDVDEKLHAFNGFVEQQADTDYMKSHIGSDLAHKIREGNVSYHWASGQVLADDPQKLLHSTDETQYHLSTQLKPYLEEILWHGLVDGEPTVLDVDPYTGFWKRFGIGCMRIVPMESLL